MRVCRTSPLLLALSAVGCFAAASPSAVAADPVVFGAATGGDADAGGAAQPRERTYPHTRLAPFMESGLLAGGETDTPGYRESPVRLYGETGLEFERMPSDSLRGHRLGLAAGAMIGLDDWRLAVGPRGTWQFRPRWAAQAFAGPLWSTEEETRGLFDNGWHVRAGLLHRNVVSFDLVWQTLPFEIRDPEPRRGRSHAVYGGVMIHGGAGALVSLGAWGAVAAIVVAVLFSYGGS